MKVIMSLWLKFAFLATFRFMFPWNDVSKAFTILIHVHYMTHSLNFDVTVRNYRCCMKKIKNIPDNFVALRLLNRSQKCVPEMALSKALRF